MKTEHEPCPKCGSGEVKFRWHNAHADLTSCRYEGTGEHFKRTCRQCKYDWYEAIP